SMILPGCALDEPEGITVYSGNAQQGYEPLVTRALRLGEVMGCKVSTTPSANAGLSGSYFDPFRNGEGVIVEWLPDGRVLVVMFTYDPDGEQMWIYADGPSNGNSAVMNALYPAASTSWGSGFDNSEIQLEPWGTITMTWDDCNNVTFEYDSIVPGYGSAERSYARLSTLQGEACALPPAAAR
ncbi:MAG: hypothetical protein KJO33_03510, partial [Gammaproteobacteria bacterium]|nr:hypothetical protein [Gammaproteobacteria bacterium]